MNGAGGLIGKVTGAIAGAIPIQVPRINFTKKGGGSSPALGSRGGGAVKEAEEAEVVAAVVPKLNPFLNLLIFQKVNPPKLKMIFMKK